jgi:DNA-binding CsgD family transcriptional regulator
VAPLSPRQLEILVLYGEGKQLREIAGELFLSPDTVRTHTQIVSNKLGTRTIVHSMVVAIARGELIIDSELCCARLPNKKNSPTAQSRNTTAVKAGTAKTAVCDIGEKPKATDVGCASIESS